MSRTIEFRILGPMELWINGNPVDPGPAKQRTVLAVMLASPGQPVTVEALVDRVWDEEPPDQVRNTIYTYISRLRAVFRECPTNPLVRADGGYVLDVADETVDLHRFQRLVDQARAAATIDRRALLRAALDQWRGTPLAGLAGAWAERVRHGLEQRRVNAAAEWARIELRLGTPETVVDTLHGLLASHPLAEVLSGYLIRALHRAGRSAEAMEHYVAARRRIMAEFGVEPGPALLAAYREVTSAATISPQPIWLEPILTAALASPEDDDVLTIVNAAGTVCNIWGQYERTLELNAVYDRRGVELARSSMAAKLAVKVIATLGIGDLPAARTQIHSLLALLDGITHAAEHSAPRRAIALGYLVDDEPAKARRYLEKALTSLHTAHPPLSSRFVLLQVLLAEAQRRCGDVGTATGTLRSALTAAISTDFQQSFPGALCAALLAADVGDTESSRRLVTEWDIARRAHGLPVPLGFTRAASTLGLDPAPPSEPAGRWDRASFTACVDSARDWCARSPRRHRSATVGKTVTSSVTRVDHLG